MDDRIHEKLDKVVDSISEINVTLARQAVSLEEHIKRSNMLEAKMVPVERHVAMVNGALKFVGLLGVLAGILEVIIVSLKGLK